MVGMVFENLTRYDRAAFQAMSEVSSRTVQRRRVLLRRTFLLILGTLCLGCGGLMLLIFHGLDFADRILAVCALLIGLVALGEGIFYRRLLAWSFWRNMRGESSGERYFLFTEEFLQTGRQGVESKYRYEVLLGAYETMGYFVLFLDRRYCMAVDKSGFSRGTAEALRNHLKEKLGKPVEFIM